jgi:4-aminobutyrate aminotransferase
MIGMELVGDRTARVPAKDLCDAIIHRAFQNGLILLSCGTSTVRFMPPLLVTRAEVDEAVTLLEASLVEAQEGLGR